MTAVAATAMLAVAVPTSAQAGEIPPADTEIIGGSNATAGEFPHQVGLLTRGISDRFQAQFCGGSIISATAVLTAAHCVEDETAGTVDILAGTHLLSGNGGQRVPATQILIHPQWNTTTSANDVAIVKVGTPLLGESVRVVQPPHESLFRAGTQATITGWGDVVGNGGFPTTLQKVTIPTVSDADCRSVFGTEFQSSNMLCIGRPQGGKDSCQGDSGGPAVVRSGANWVQVGVVSWGYGCALPGLPGVYSRVSGLSSFIGPHLQPRAHPFYDISPWLEDAAAWIHANDVMDGFTDGTFGPTANLTRAQAIRLLWRLEGSPAVGTPHGFDDVAAWVAPAVRWAAEDPDGPGGVEPIVTGYGKAFRPDALITRGAWSRMLHRIAAEVPASQPHTFSDVPAWVTDAVSWIADPINVPPFAEGFDDGTFLPLARINRGQAARMVFRIHTTP